MSNIKKRHKNKNRKCPTLGTFIALESHQQIIFWSIFILVLLVETQGYSADIPKEMDQMTTNVMNTIFSPWVKKTALVFGGGMGLFQAYGAGSIKPLLVWGGLGLAVNYVPKIAELIGSMG